jgi:lipid-binding SYLF domain-containing protein
MQRGFPKRNPMCLRKLNYGKMDGAVLIAASLVAAIRMRGAEIRDSPKLNSTIYDSIALARMVLSRMEKQPM